MIVKFRGIRDERDIDWFLDRNSITLCNDTTAIFAVDETDKILAACFMDNWTETSCQVHLAIDNPLIVRHGFFQEIGSFIFEEGGRLMVHGLVPADNKRALSVDKKLGFREVARLKDAFKRGVDYIVLELRPEDCKFYEYKG